MKYNILDFGAVVSDQLQTKAIQSAIDKCFLDGGGEVIIPCGVFRTGSIRLRSNTTLHLMSGAVLEGSDNCEDYFDFAEDAIEPARAEDMERPRGTNPYNRWHHGIIHVLSAENVSIIGEPGSYINGRNCYDANGEEGYRGPHGIVIFDSNNIKLKGYIVKDCANWAHNIFETKNIEIENITVYGGHDGIDIRTCDNVRIENCNLYTGDDAIAGYDNLDVVIKNCVFNSACSALRFGGTDILVDNCRSFAPARFAHRYYLSKEKQALGLYTDETCNHKLGAVFTYYCDYRAKIRKTPGNITIQNCDFDGHWKLFIMEFSEESRWCCNRALTQIKYKDCKIKNLHSSITIFGDENEKITFELENVEISAAPDREEEAFMRVKNFDAVNMKNVSIKGYEKNEIIVTGECGALNLENSDEVTVANR